MYFEKTNPLPHFRKNNYRSTIEETVWFTLHKEYIFNFLEQKDMKQIFKGAIGRKHSKHPTEKYDWMIEPIIKRHSNENDIILDPFAGSGAILFNANKYNRKWIGIELKEEYCEMFVNRLSVGV